MATREVPGDAPALEEILGIAHALDRLADIDERLCRIVECRFFAGMTEPETATALQISERTVRRDWLRARAWLREALTQPDDPASAHAS